MSRANGRSARADYLLASRFARAPVIHGVADFWRNYDGDPSAACARAARFELAKGDDPREVYDFYSGFWIAISNLSGAAFLLVGIAIKALNLGPTHRLLVALVGTAIIRRPRILGGGRISIEYVSANLESTASDGWAAVLIGLVVAAIFVMTVMLS
jgi:hypothetical protein